jgi:ferredoxin
MTEPTLYDPMPHAGHTWTVHLQPGGKVIPVATGHTVLQAALAAGLELPSSCRNGTCRACLSRLLAGDIRYVIEWPGVSAEEKAEGYFLPCVACPQTDIVMETAPT